MYDRAVIPAPYGMDTSLDIVTPLVRSRGTVHYYTFKQDGEIPGLIDEFAKKGLETVLWRRCGNVAPGVHRLVFDLVKLG
jgi:tRNA (guanine37-N1)-methyltransferase